MAVELKAGKSGLQQTRVLVPLALIAVLAILIAILVGPFLTPYDFTAIDLERISQPPVFLPGSSTLHLLGTDNLGRDVASRLIVATQVSVCIALSGSLLSTILGTSLGLLSVQYRGLVGNLIMAFVDIQSSLPYLVFALAALAFLGNTPVVLIAVIGFSSWEQFARLTRALVLSVVERDYIMAARSLGTGSRDIYRWHILPNIAGTLIVQFSVSFSGTILLETTLSFLGLGIVPPATSLGQMIGEGRSALLTVPWASIVPGTVIVLLTLTVATLGDWFQAYLIRN